MPRCLFTKYERKKLESPSEIEKNLMKRRCCVTPCGQTDVGSSQQKHFLPFRILLNVGIDPNFPQRIFFFVFGFIQRKISLSCENIFSLATHNHLPYKVNLRYMS